MSTAIDFTEAPRAIAVALGAVAGVYFKDSIPGPDFLEPIVGAILGAKAYDFSNGDTSISLPMDMGSWLGAAGGALALTYPMGFDPMMAVPAGAFVGDFVGSMFL